ITEHKAKLAGEVKNFDPSLYIEKKEINRMDRYCQFAMAAAKEAMEDSGFDVSSVNPYKFGVLIGSGIGGLMTIEDEHTKFIEKGPKRTSPLLIPMIIANIASGNVAIKYGAKGVCTTIVTACATGTQAVGESFQMILDGRADAILTGGAEACVADLAIAGFSNATAMCLSEDVNRASIPFDAERSGFVMGEGAGVLLLEEYEHAKKRGAKIYAEISGYGTTCDAYHITSPNPEAEGAMYSMKFAMEQAGVQPSEISYINAHGTSTGPNDRMETKAVKKAFGEDLARKIPMSSTKSMTGHLLGAAGAVEAIICAKTVQEGFITPTINYKVADPECDLDCVPNTGRKADVRYAISNSFGFGGHNATLLFKKYEG
ncbi:MAG TPA: beta-ketoacyl-ACP synthase II, partial [Spirochaetota bacterium]|nr:beta-ketoacyl-ACP synthase II [Spirochaetota bacterium]